MALAPLLEKTGRALVLEKFREPLRGYLLKAGYERVPYELFTILFFIALIVTTGLHFFFLLGAVDTLNPLLFSLSVFVFWLGTIGLLVAIAIFFIWTFLNLKIYSRTKEMEEKLPEYLSLVVTNLRSGMSFDKSLWAAIRPEFGVLAREITIVSKKVMTGNDTSEALGEFAARYESPILRRSISLIISEIESGGEVANVIERVIDNLRKTRELKKEMAASVVSYMIFISIIVLFLAPILFALANTILSVILGFANQIAAAPSGAGGITGSASTIFESLNQLARTGDQLLADFKLFSYFALSVLSIFAGMIVSILEKGDIRGGVKYIPVFLCVTIIVFTLAHSGLSATFGSFL